LRQRRPAEREKEAAAANQNRTAFTGHESWWVQARGPRQGLGGETIPEYAALLARSAEPGKKNSLAPGRMNQAIQIALAPSPSGIAGLAQKSPIFMK
jgi:hypothetical protein